MSNIYYIVFIQDIDSNHNGNSEDDSKSDETNHSNNHSITGIDKHGIDISRDLSDLLYQNNYNGSNVEINNSINDEVKANPLILDDNVMELLEYYRDNIIGNDYIFDTPFGKRKIMYLDWTASGKQLKFIENYLLNEVSTLYANTHTTTSITGIQTTKYRNESRNIIAKSCGLNNDNDIVLFCGSGVTGAINKLVCVLQRRTDYNPKKSVAIIGPYEHNSYVSLYYTLI